MASRIVQRYMLNATAGVPYGNVLTAGLDENGALTVWVEHEFPVDPARIMFFFTVDEGAELTRSGEWVGTVLVSGAVTHVYNAGLIIA